MKSALVLVMVFVVVVVVVGFGGIGLVHWNSPNQLACF